MDRRIEAILDMIDRNLPQFLSFAQLSSAVNLSESRLRHLFKQETGTTIAEYIKTNRLKRARELVEGSFLTVKQVMASVGLSDESHFIRIYKRAFGLSPGESRRRLPFRKSRNKQARHLPKRK